MVKTGNIDIENFYLQSNQSLQRAKNVVIRNSKLNTKDAFGETENVTVCDSELTGCFLS